MMTATMIGETLDDELTDAAAGGSPDAFAALYERHRPEALRLARRLTASPVDADDVVAETFTAMWHAFDAGHGPRCSFRTYLLTSVRRECGHQARRHHPEADIADHEATADDRHHESEAMPDRLLVRRAFDALPVRWRTALWAADVEQAQPATIAQQLGISRRAAIALVHRARRALGHAYVRTFATERAGTPCAATASLLVESVLDDVSASDRALIDEHMRGCPACADLAGDLRGLRRALRSLGPAAAPLAARFWRGATTAIGSKIAGAKLLLGISCAAISVAVIEPAVVAPPVAARPATSPAVVAPVPADQFLGERPSAMAGPLTPEVVLTRASTSSAPRRVGEDVTAAAVVPELSVQVPTVARIPAAAPVAAVLTDPARVLSSIVADGALPETAVAFDTSASVGSTVSADVAALIGAKDDVVHVDVAAMGGPDVDLSVTSATVGVGLDGLSTLSVAVTGGSSLPQLEPLVSPG